MAILVNKGTRVVVLGITGGAGSFHAKQCMEYGTQIVAGVTPNRGGEMWEGKVPVFNTVSAAVRETGADCALIFVPPPGAADAIMEAADVGVALAVCITEGIPTMDMVKVRRFLADKTTKLIGPNCPGIITPGERKIGIMPGHVHKPGPIGVVSRSGTLTYEAVGQLMELGLGQTTCVGTGGDPVNGMKHIDVLRMFNDDPETEAVIMVGEIGGSDEETAALWVKDNMKKPVVGFIAGVTAPAGKRMGHAGAIISGGKGTAQEKLAVMEACGIKVTRNPAEMGKTLKSILK